MNALQRHVRERKTLWKRSGERRETFLSKLKELFAIRKRCREITRMQG